MVNKIVPFFRPEYVKIAKKDHLRKSEQFLKMNFGEYFFTSSGRASIYHILKENKLSNSLIGLPVYACGTIKEAIIKSGNIPCYIDFDPIDLNISFDSFKEAVLCYDIKAVIVPSLYGNPAQLDLFEDFCFQNNILMIDDSAQSFGAKLNGKMIGTYGHAGLFSASVGKSLAGFMGASISINRISAKVT